MSAALCGAASITPQLPPGGGERRGGEWTEGKRWAPEQLPPLKFSSVPEPARLARMEQFGRMEWDRDSAGSGQGWERGHLGRRLWAFGKAASRGRDLETPGEGRLAGAQGLPC